MTLTPIDDLPSFTLTENEIVVDPSRAQMLARRANDIDAVLIERESSVNPPVAQSYGRRNIGNSKGIIQE